MVRRIPAITIEHLNQLLDVEQAMVKKLNVSDEKKNALLIYIESLQRRINQSAFDQMAQQMGENNG